MIHFNYQLLFYFPHISTYYNGNIPVIFCASLMQALKTYPAVLVEVYSFS